MVSRWLSHSCGQAWDWWKKVEGPQRPKWVFLANLQKICNLWLNPFSSHQGSAPPCLGDLIAPNNRNQSQHGMPAWPTFVRWHLTLGQKRYCWYYIGPAMLGLSVYIKKMISASLSSPSEARAQCESWRVCTDLPHSPSTSIEVKEEKKPMNGERMQKYCFSGDIAHTFCFLSLKDAFFNMFNSSAEFLAKISP